MKNKSKLKIVIIVLGIIFAFLTFSNFKFSDDKGNNDGTREIRNDADLKSPEESGFWPNCPRVHIKNDNWSETALDWIQVNSGTFRI